MTVPSNRGLCFKFKRVLEFISLLNVEPFIFFHIINSSLKKVPTDQLIQDKICLFKYHLKADYCLNLPEMSADDDVLHKKSTILAELTEYSLYTTLISTVPMLLASLLVGSWTDKYVSAKKALFIAGAVTGIIESLILLGNVYFYSYRKKKRIKK